VDLLKSEEFRRFTERPETLREEVDYQQPQSIVIDEIQRVPALLNEVHWLYENRTVQCALWGSSARKIRHSKVNLLGGRGFHLELYGFSAIKLGNEFNLQQRMLVSAKFYFTAIGIVNFSARHGGLSYRWMKKTEYAATA
jgi:predicted AAA+ superfamily ATPase